MWCYIIHEVCQNNNKCCLEEPIVFGCLWCIILARMVSMELALLTSLPVLLLKCTGHVTKQLYFNYI